MARKKTDLRKGLDAFTEGLKEGLGIQKDKRTGIVSGGHKKKR